MRFFEQRLLWSVGLALATHSLLALLWPKLEIEHTRFNDDSSLTIRLYKQEPELQEQLLEETEDQNVPEPVQNTAIATEQPSTIELDANESEDSDKEPEPDLVISPSSLKNWATNEAKEYGKQEEKTDLSTIREGSYVDQWLDSNRVDTRDSAKDTKTSVAGGTIWVKKVKGKLICVLVGHEGKTTAFKCGDPERNQFIDAYGSIKNSDRVDW